MEEDQSGLRTARACTLPVNIEQLAILRHNQMVMVCDQNRTKTYRYWFEKGLLQE